MDISSPRPSFFFTAALPQLEAFGVVSNADAVRLEPLPRLPDIQAQATPAAPQDDEGEDNGAALSRSVSIRNDEADWRESLEEAERMITRCEKTEEGYVAALHQLSLALGNAAVCCEEMPSEAAAVPGLAAAAAAADAAAEMVLGCAQQGRRLQRTLVATQKQQVEALEARRELLTVWPSLPSTPNASK